MGQIQESSIFSVFTPPGRTYTLKKKGTFYSKIHAKKARKIFQFEKYISKKGRNNYFKKSCKQKVRQKKYIKKYAKKSMRKMKRQNKK